MANIRNLFNNSMNYLKESNNIRINEEFRRSFEGFGLKMWYFGHLTSFELDFFVRFGKVSVSSQFSQCNRICLLNTIGNLFKRKGDCRQSEWRCRVIYWPTLLEALDLHWNTKWSSFFSPLPQNLLLSPTSEHLICPKML